MSLFNRNNQKHEQTERDKHFKIFQFIKIEGLRTKKKEKFEPTPFISPIFGTTVKDVTVAPYVNKDTGDKAKQLDFLRDEPIIDPKEYHEFKGTIVTSETRREVFGEDVYIDKTRKISDPFEKANKIHVPYTGKEKELTFDEVMFEEPIIKQKPVDLPVFEEPLEKEVITEQPTEEIIVTRAPEPEVIAEKPILKEPEIKLYEPELLEKEETEIKLEDKPQKPQYVEKEIPYVHPSPTLFNKVERNKEDMPEWLIEQKERINQTLKQFNIPGQVENIVKGPTVTRHEIKLEAGVNVNAINTIRNNLMMELAARALRLESPIPGKPFVGIELPNAIAEIVAFGNVVDDPEFLESDSPLKVALGVDIDGKNIYEDIGKMPHGLVAGATNSGKSVCVNTIIMSLLIRNHPDDLKFIMIDPKMVELTIYNDLPHLATPVITDAKVASTALSWVTEEMDRRFLLFSKVLAKDLVSYNKKIENDPSLNKLPYIVIVIDELADLMMTSPADVEASIQRITQKARAAGIHLIVATQRPTTDVIKGTIKANILTRVAFKVSSNVDSQVILDVGGAEDLLGRGDMLLKKDDRPIRLQGAYITDDEIEKVTRFIKNQMEPNYLINLTELQDFAVNKEITETDTLFYPVLEFVISEGHASINAIQKQFSLGFNRAQKLVDLYEELKYVGPQEGRKPREVFITLEQLENAK